MTSLTKKTVLITGAAGFLGANLIRSLLKAEAKVHAIVRPTSYLGRLSDILHHLTIHVVDLSGRSQLKEIIEKCAPEVIFHFAVASGHAKTQQERLSAVQDNVVVTANLLEATLNTSVKKIIYAGSSLEYGPHEIPLSETMRLAPTVLRGATKAAASLICQQYAFEYQLPLVILRIFSAYGPWEPYRFIPKVLWSALYDKEIFLTDLGYRHDFIFVEDIVNACLQTLSKELSPGEIINIGSGEQWKNEEVIALVEEITAKKLKVEIGKYPNSPSDTKYWVADIQKAKKLLSWSPQYSLKKGLEKTLKWIQQNEEFYRSAAAERGIACLS